MKTKIIFLTVALFAMLLPSCSDDDTKTDVDNQLSEVIQKDINERFAESKVKSFHQDSIGSVYVYLIDKNNNNAELRYKKDEFEAESRIIPDFKDLPQKVQTAFDSLSIKGISDLTIYRTERSYLKHDLYTFSFLQTTDKVTNLQYNIFIDEDGILYSINHTINDIVMLFPNYLEEFSIVEEKYTDADVRCQLNELGHMLLIIKHDNYLKKVYFDNDIDTSNPYWKETRYQLPLDYPVPANVIASLHKQFPDFTYTEITKIENPTGNSYLFVDGTRDDKLGYGIPE